MNHERRKRLQQINDALRENAAQCHRLVIERTALELAAIREEHPCECVKLGRDIEIYDNAELERRNRRGIGAGLISETLSARKDCKVCGGSGCPADPAGRARE